MFNLLFIASPKKIKRSFYLDLLKIVKSTQWIGSSLYKRIINNLIKDQKQPKVAAYLLVGHILFCYIEARFYFYLKCNRFL